MPLVEKRVSATSEEFKGARYSSLTQLLSASEVDRIKVGPIAEITAV